MASNVSGGDFLAILVSTLYHGIRFENHLGVTLDRADSPALYDGLDSTNYHNFSRRKAARGGSFFLLPSPFLLVGVDTDSYLPIRTSPRQDEDLQMAYFK